ncbi:hypothetical protein PBNK5_17240 [Pectobacterium brasiliense]
MVLVAVLLSALSTVQEDGTFGSLTVRESEANADALNSPISPNDSDKTRLPD